MFYSFSIRLISQASIFGAGCLAFEANQWMTVGHGLNPFLAIPIATLFLVAPYFIKD